MSEKLLTTEQLATTLITVATTIAAARKCDPKAAVAVAREIIEEALWVAQEMLLEQDDEIDAGMQTAQSSTRQMSKTSSDPLSEGRKMVQQRNERYSNR